MSWAMKASAICINGQWQEIYKDPITSQSKRSKKGILALVKQGSDWLTIKQSELNGQTNQLQTVFFNGKLFIEENLTEIRLRTTSFLV